MIFKFNDIEYEIKDATIVDTKEAEKAKQRAFSEAIDNGFKFQIEIQEELRKRKLFSKEQEERREIIFKELDENLHKLEKGGIKLSEAKSLAVRSRELRAELISINMIKNSIAQESVEGYAEDRHLRYLTYRCLVNKDTQQRPFGNFEQFEGDETGLAYRACLQMTEKRYGSAADIDKEFPENKFLSEYGFVNEDLMLVNKDGHLIDTEGRLINEFGQLVNENDQLIDEDGNVIEVTEKERKPFLDDDGNPVEPIKAKTEDDTKDKKPETEKEPEPEQEQTVPKE